MRSLAIVLLVAASPAHAERIKLGTMAPKGSTWEAMLKEMGQKWSEASGGRVKLVIYPAGVLGGEGDMVTKMRIGQLQAAALTTIGLHEIAAEPQAVDAPLMIDSWKTLDYVMQEMGPKLESDLDAKGYVVLGWSEIGFVRFFSTKRYDSIAEMQQKAKVFTWEGDPASAEAWKAAGFHPVVLSSTDIVPSLQTGLIDTVPMAPLYALSSRAFERARYMTDLPWAVLTGAIVVTKQAWEQIPPDVRAKLLDISRQYARRIAVEVRRMESDSLAQMKTEGLVAVTPRDPAGLQRPAQASWNVIRGRVVPAQTFDEVAELVRRAHARK
jgi:TRAP-type C4-dicarboxylate transport system substrate-binding protein